ncbi:hypothetical protein Q8A73_017911 [Channa argus]|nr:hypothetical protein Q8A73_017911 [Channa argus]
MASRAPGGYFLEGFRRPGQLKYSPSARFLPSPAAQSEAGSSALGWEACYFETSKFPQPLNAASVCPAERAEEVRKPTDLSPIGPRSTERTVIIEEEMSAKEFLWPRMKTRTAFTFGYRTE